MIRYHESDVAVMYYHEDVTLCVKHYRHKVCALVRSNDGPIWSARQTNQLVRMSPQLARISAQLSGMTMVPVMT